MKNNITVKDIIEFMKWKTKELEETWPDYFTEVDEKNLIASEINAKEFFESIQYIINNYGVNDTTDCDFCPFCYINFPDCNDCLYGKEHGMCGLEEDDDYSKFKEYNNVGSIIEYIGGDKIVMYLIKKGLIEYEQPN